ncbi:hypothetical protein [Scytonema hofmannii]|uniref:hypothetical protein n=1 Tax=Scytonema hofmannii TaxID=34078 RepID=UPI0013148CBB|nr:hypothetical protein [Scytonema hofmannii]
MAKISTVMLEKSLPYIQPPSHQFDGCNIPNNSCKVTESEKCQTTARSQFTAIFK